MPDDDSYEVLSFGIDADTGRPIPAPDVDDVAELARGNPPGETGERRRTLDIKLGAAAADTGVQDDLAAMGWAVLFAEADPRADAIERALQPLIKHRTDQAGALCKVLKEADGYQAGMDAVTWLGKRKLGLDLVDPEKGLPFYVVLIGDPSLIPMEFQFRLDIFWAVGRLDFLKVEDYERYAESVVAHETAKAKGNGRIGLFAPRHDFDPATQLFHKVVVQDLKSKKLPGGFVWRDLLAAAATKEAYQTLISGDDGASTPQLIFTGGHGMEFAIDDVRQPLAQGALVCQDWAGYGGIDKDEWIAASDIPQDALLAGTIHLIFACYGGGCSKIDTFRDKDGTALQISKADTTAALPRALLLHENGGALAVIAHVDRAFACSFSLNSGAPQTQGLQDVLWSLMRNHRAGNALDRFNSRWGATSTVLSDAISKPVDQPGQNERLYQLWIARDDARNYVLLGDPAVRLNEDG